MITNGSSLRRVCERKFTGRFARSTKGWDGTGGIAAAQKHIDDNWTWQDDATPVTAAEIFAKDSEYDAEELARKNTEKIKQTIETLEASVTPQRLRAAILNAAGNSWLQSVDDQIAAERAKL